MARKGTEARDAMADVQRLLDECVGDTRHKATSLRLNESLWGAAELAVRQGWAPSLTVLVEQSLAAQLAGLVSNVAEQAALDDHYQRHPEARSDLWEVAVAAAEIDAVPVADRPDLIRRAAEALAADGDVDSILLWAAGALAATAP